MGRLVCAGYFNYRNDQRKSFKRYSGLVVSTWLECALSCSNSREKRGTCEGDAKECVKKVSRLMMYWADGGRVSHEHVRGKVLHLVIMIITARS